MAEGKIIIVSAPSGCGKSTIINAVMGSGERDLGFSVSATNRPPRAGEVDGVNYHFLSTDEFRRRIAAGDFVEYEEVYPGRYYGTLKSEVERITGAGHNVVLDIDVKGGVNVKRMYGDRALSLFIEPPCVEALRSRLEGRGTESPEEIDKRVGRAAEELAYASRYDRRVVNDDLAAATAEVAGVIDSFIGR